MKKLKTLFTSLFIVLSMMMSLTACAAQTTPKTTVNDILILLQINNPNMHANGVEKEIDEGRGTTPIVDNGRTLVPIRSIIEECGGTVKWEQDTQTAILNYNSDEIKLIINSNTAYLNGKENTIDVAPQIINGRTMLPIRFVQVRHKSGVFSDKRTKKVPCKVHFTLCRGFVQSGNYFQVP